MTPNRSLTSPARQAQQAGFTLLELLIGMVILGILMGAFTQIFGYSLATSSQLNARNELVSEGQIAQQLIASRLQSAYFIYPTGTTFSMTGSGVLAKNTVRTQNYNWTVGTDPILALIAPPKVYATCPASSAGPGDADACFTFYAYYPVRRSELTNPNITSSKWFPDDDPQNANTWILMEYRSNLLDGVTRSQNGANNCSGSSSSKTGQGYLSCPPNTTTILTNAATSNPTIKGRSAQMLVDYVQPLGAAPYNTMFNVDTTNRFVDVNLRLQQIDSGRTLVAPGENSLLSTRVYPRNWF